MVYIYTKIDILLKFLIKYCIIFKPVVTVYTSKLRIFQYVFYSEFSIFSLKQIVFFYKFCVLLGRVVIAGINPCITKAFSKLVCFSSKFSHHRMKRLRLRRLKSIRCPPPYPPPCPPFAWSVTLIGP